MVIRRFVYNEAADVIIEVSMRGSRPTSLADVFKEVKEQHKLEQSESAGRQLREAALDIADRRVFAHKRYGDERRWRG